MLRINMIFPERMVAQLKQLSVTKNVSYSSVVREAITAFLAENGFVEEPLSLPRLRKGGSNPAGEVRKWTPKKESNSVKKENRVARY